MLPFLLDKYLDMVWLDHMESVCLTEETVHFPLFAMTTSKLTDKFITHFQEIHISSQYAFANICLISDFTLFFLFYNFLCSVYLILTLCILRELY